uniref:Tumor protein p53-inducible nuclear protein 1 n=1 Tax=Timema bartmani TaxID=61472 RepID=A0A7R9I1R8_9NEOP|nr:unnamed protein product [Timema bartmani]
MYSEFCIFREVQSTNTAIGRVAAMNMCKQAHHVLKQGSVPGAKHVPFSLYYSNLVVAEYYMSRDASLFSKDWAWSPGSGGPGTLVPIVLYHTCPSPLWRACVLDNMFTSLANYLRGGEPSRDVAGTVTTGVRFTAVEAGDDWLLVDRATDSRSSSLCDSDLEDETDCDCRSLEVVISAIPAPSLATRTSSASSLPCLSLEESWFVTPPPCFTSEGPVHMETSPFENLLIEHPSMSVYQHSSSPVTYVPPRGSQSAPSSPAAPLEEDEVPPQDSAPAPASSGRRQAVYSLHQQQERQCIQIRSAQKIYQRRSCQSLKRNHLDRSNKAREINSRNKLKRRSDHMLNHSGANNNRKC